MAIIKTATVPTVTAPALSGTAAAVVKIEYRRIAAAEKDNREIAKLFAVALDAARDAGVPRSQAGVEALQKSFTDGVVAALRERVKLPETATVKEVWEASPLKRKTMTEYGQGLARAFYWDIEWSADLKNDKERKLPWSTGAAPNPATAPGPVTTATPEPEEGDEEAAPTGGSKADPFAQALAVINRDAARKEAFIAWVKAHADWN